MRECWPAFSRGFQCRAGACRHTCCAGWDIDVDEESAYRFMTYKGEIGAIMKRYLAEKDSGYQILLDEERRCPFLQRDGLCMLIREKGEEALCSICAEHPRFYVETEKLLLCGLGLSCEEACERFLGERDFMFDLSDKDEAVSFSELMEIGGFYCPRKDYPGYPAADEFQEFIGAVRETEWLDPKWRTMLDGLAEKGSLRSPMRPKNDAAVLNRIYQYILYRQAAFLTVKGWNRICRFAQMNTTLIDLLSQEYDTLKEIVRLWSEEIEYSTQNVSILINACAK